MCGVFTVVTNRAASSYVLLSRVQPRRLRLLLDSTRPLPKAVSGQDRKCRLTDARQARHGGAMKRKFVVAIAAACATAMIAAVPAVAAVVASMQVSQTKGYYGQETVLQPSVDTTLVPGATFTMETSKNGSCVGDARREPGHRRHRHRRSLLSHLGQHGRATRHISGSRTARRAPQWARTPRR